MAFSAAGWNIYLFIACLCDSRQNCNTFSSESNVFRRTDSVRIGTLVLESMHVRVTFFSSTECCLELQQESAVESVPRGCFVPLVVQVPFAHVAVSQLRHSVLGSSPMKENPTAEEIGCAGEGICFAVLSSRSLGEILKETALLWSGCSRVARLVSRCTRMSV